jgi:3-hydroxyisobutyrate dehydrogenase
VSPKIGALQGAQAAAQEAHMTGTEDVAVLGAGGTMGLPIARNLARAGFRVRAWNRTREKADPLSQDGARVLDSPEQAAAGAAILITMVADAEAALGAADGALGCVTQGAVWIQMSTIGETGTQRCASLAAERGVGFVDAPVLGTREPAEERRLVVMASGAQALRGRVQPVFDAVSARTMWVGEAGAGSRLKLATNAWILALVEGAAETLALAEGLGLDPQLVLDAVADGPLDLPYLQMKGKAIIERDFEPSFRLALAAKDARLAEESAVLHELRLPLVETIRRRLEQGAVAHPDADMSATYLTSAPPGAAP